MRYKKHGIAGPRGFLPRTLAWAAAAIVLALAGCGDLSLYSALEGDVGGDFRLSPQTALVPEGTPFTFSALGGFLPYEVTVAGLTAKDEHTWEFPASFVTFGDSDDYTIEATDLLGNTATATVTVFTTVAQPVLNETVVTLTAGDSWTFTVSGGRAPFVWTLDDVVQSAITNSSYPHLFAAAGSYTVGLTDSLGFYCEAEVSVVLPPAPDVPLVISPTSASVVVGGMLSFEAFGGNGSYSFSALPGSITNTNPATFTAPVTPGTCTVTLTDTSVPPRVATAAVVVTASTSDPLALSPSSPKVTAEGDTVLFTAAGGVPPYTFSSKKPSDGNFLDPANSGQYTHLRAKKDVEVRLTDSTGKRVTTKVRWK